jgi:MoaA/NifB/PqqE/SkfB family radical SAM enzyme
MELFLEKLKQIAERNYINLEPGFDTDIIVLSHEQESIICILSNLSCCLTTPSKNLICLSPAEHSSSQKVRLVVSKDGEVCILSSSIEEKQALSLKIKALEIIQLYKDMPVLLLEFAIDKNDSISLCQANTDVNLIELNSISPVQAGNIFETVLRALFPNIFYANLMDPGQKFTESGLVAAIKNRKLIKKQKNNQDFFYRPEGIDLEITQKCTLACKQCSILTEVKAGFAGLDWKVYSNALSEASNFGMYSYSITGGEPFIRFNDVCRIIESSQSLNIECFKIQTNCSYFSSAEKSNNLIKALVSSGFGNNKITNACIHCSQGIQNYEPHSNNENLLHIARALKPYIHSASFPLISFGLIYTLDPFVDELEVYANLRRELSSKANFDWSNDRASIRICPVDYSDETAEKHWNKSLIPLRELLEIRVKTFGNCFHSDLTPWPRMLMRANGEVFACTCFGHVYSLGKYPENSIEDLIKIANKIPAFRRIHQDGLLGLLDYIEEHQKPGFGETLVPGSMTACQLCGIMNGVRKAEFVQIGS